MFSSTVHGRNVFGQNAEYKCDDSGDDRADGCQGAIICYPDPLGCFCPAGYKGLNCSQECETGKFGANCKQECHCADNTLCALDTGVCENNQCEDGWRGTNCQLVDGPCPVGVYGDFCNLPCSCSGGEDACSEVEANCVNGCAVPWTGIACDQGPCPRHIVSASGPIHVLDKYNLRVQAMSNTHINLRTRAMSKSHTVSDGLDSETVCVGYGPYSEIAYSGPGSIVSFDQIRGNPGQLYIVSCSAVRNPVIDSSSLQLNILAPRLESRVEERAYLTTNTWHLPYTTTPIGCAFQTTGHFEYQQFSLLPPFILPVYANPSNVLNFSDVTSTSITVSWPAWNHETDIGDGPIIDYRIQYQEEGMTKSFMEVKKGGGLSHQFTGLQPDTQYEFRIVLVREGQGGEGAPSNTQRQRTLCQGKSLISLLVYSQIIYEKSR
ncbi:hypothetical protein BSL78_18271 [Apostichopus japonicus]|uniref:Tyrosine-protein kinase n=1 Tax=Stichopus japonicus TaxID=307972 RepID=A0A2G8KA44_STIJA|nr:hypothetical protein BSL78_18271 [Apostichopus japonicus]